MAKLKTEKEWGLYTKFYMPGTSIMNSVKLNAIFISKANTKEHESMKFELAWEALSNGENFLTEAERESSEQEIQVFKGKKKIVDFVNLSRGQEVEIVFKHETDEQIRFYREKGVLPIIIGDKIICDKCKHTYPRRNKGKTCQLCKK